jgi:GntR family transcriptional regulator/MocR family aminotransferase
MVTMTVTLPIELDRAGSEPLYRQVEANVRRAIDSGRLRPGQRLPSVRALAGQLGVGRLTIATAYEQLAADGYLVGRMGFGTIVAPNPPPVGGPAGPNLPGGRATGAIRLPMLQSPGPGGAGPTGRRRLGPMPRYDLRAGGSGGTGTAGGPGLTVGPVFERLLREEWRVVADGGGTGATADPAGDPLLRAAIAAHLRATRGASCEPGQVVILSGAIIGIGAVARLWLGPDRRVVVEDPGDPVYRRALTVSGGELAPVAIDDHGLHPEALPEEAAVAVVAPSVQIPTGATMPLARRVRLLAWAGVAGALVVEDARADDLTLRGAPPVCLQGLDGEGRVIHLGAFESLLHSGVRVAYAVVPPGLVDAFIGALDAIDPGPSPVQQRALGRFVADGDFDRHLGKVRRALLDRQDATLEALERELGWLLEVRPRSGGTRLIAAIVDPAWSAADVVRSAADAGVALDSLGPNRVRPGPDRELVIDYGHHEPSELRSAIRALGRALAGPRAPARTTRSGLPSLPPAASPA